MEPLQALEMGPSDCLASSDFFELRSFCSQSVLLDHFVRCSYCFTACIRLVKPYFEVRNNVSLPFDFRVRFTRSDRKG